jgi:DNA (cytosine-5)-methyltransferase 1
MKHAGFFEGIGGFSEGAKRAGVETIYTCELDDFRNEWLQYILPNAIHERDITTATGCYADVFTGGFPCQDISSANPRGKGLEGKRSGLYYTFFEIISHHRPKYVVLENSPNIISKGDLLIILRDFAKIGYDAEWQVISKRPFGFPDERERFVLVAYSSEIGRNASNPVFNTVAFEKCLKTQEQNEFILNKLSRRNSLADWTKFITRTLQNDTGISKELVAKEIAAYGDAINPNLAHLIFELIKLHSSQQ